MNLNDILKNIQTIKDDIICNFDEKRENFTTEYLVTIELIKKELNLINNELDRVLRIYILENINDKNSN